MANSMARIQELANGIKKHILPKFKIRKARSHFVDWSRLARKYPQYRDEIAHNKNNQARLQVIKKKCIERFAPK